MGHDIPTVIAMCNVKEVEINFFLYFSNEKDQILFIH